MYPMWVDTISTSKSREKTDTPNYALAPSLWYNSVSWYLVEDYK